MKHFGAFEAINRLGELLALIEAGEEVGRLRTGQSLGGIALLDSLGINSAWVPVHWSLVVSNALRSAALRGRLLQPAADLLRALSRLKIQMDVESFARADDTTQQLATGHNLSVYDAAYLELAIRRGLPLATADKQIGRAAESCSVPLLPASPGTRLRDRIQESPA